MRLEWQADCQPVLFKDNGHTVPVAWAPQPGSQTAFLACPVFEALLEGNRGGGKTSVLLADFLQHVGQGWRHEWRGILFRRTFPELEDVIGKSRPLFKAAWPAAEYNEAKSFWKFPDGERLYFRQFQKPADYWKYHGQQFTWIAWEELTTWPDLVGYRSMMSCARSSVPGMPIKIRSTTNPYGTGHNQVKARFRLPIGGGRVIGPIIADSLDDDGEPEPPRVAIHSSLAENRILLHADPHYIQRIKAAASNPAQADAWIKGDWDIVAGGMFDDVWNPRVHLVRPFPIPLGWRLDRSFDWGSSAPFSVLWWAESDGSDVQCSDGRKIRTIRGDLFLVGEWYGWNGKPNEGMRMDEAEIAKGIKASEREMFPGRLVHPGPADSQIFERSRNNRSIADEHAEHGVRWMEVVKGPGSRVSGFQHMRTMMRAADPPMAARESPGMFIFDGCEQFKRTVPTLPRSDKNPDDVDKQAEDHCADSCRYRISIKRGKVITKQVRGR